MIGEETNGNSFISHNNFIGDVAKKNNHQLNSGYFYDQLKIRQTNSSAQLIRMP